MSGAKDWVETLPLATEKYTLFGKTIGEGDSSIVFKAKSGEGAIVAVKVQDENAETLDWIYQEFIVLEELKKVESQTEIKHYPDFLGAYRKKSDNTDPSQIWFVFEYLEGVPLHLLLQYLEDKAKPLAEDLIAYILQSTSMGIKHLHEQGIIHRDIKGSNIFIGRDGQVKIMDFGMSAKLETPLEKTLGTLGSPYWIAPEVIYSSDQGIWYDSRADVWSLGILAIELSEYNPPLSRIYPSQAIFHIIQNPPPSLTNLHEWSQNFNDFISECLVKNPDHRPWSCEIVEHPFLQQFNLQTDEIRTILSSFVNEITDADVDKAQQQNTKEFYESSIKSVMFKVDRKTIPTQILPHDLATMSHTKLTEEAVIKTISARFSEGNIYSYIGDILVAINPFGSGINASTYCPHFASKYKFNARSNNEPHIFAVGDRAYQDMLHHKEPQKIIFSGETCSGKTFAAKQLLTHLVNWTCGSNNELKDKVLSVSNILEAFCNASSFFNPNATRSVQYFELDFTSTGKLVGWSIWNYCMEKWRVTDLPQDRNQTNFHIFQWLSNSKYFNGTEEQVVKYNYVQHHNANTTQENESLQFNIVHKAFQTLGFSEDQIRTIIEVITGIIILGEIVFEQLLDNEEPETYILNSNIVEKVSTLFKIKSKTLSWALTNYCIVQDDEIVRAHTNCKESFNLRDGLARAIYIRLVDWIINIINTKSGGFGRLISPEKYVIGMIDFPGFECYIKDNNFEQFTINLINEQVQFFYNHRVFMVEMQDNISEEIGYTNYQYHENSDLLDAVLSRSGGFLKLLDDATKISLDETKNNFLDSIRTKLKSRFIRTSNENELKIAHYSGLVKYNVNKFPKKNRHYLSQELIEVMRQSDSPIISELFKNKLTKTGSLGMSLQNDSSLSKLQKKILDPTKGKYSQTKEAKSTASNLRNSLFEIFMKISDGSEHFVRCIRSNLKFQPNSIDSSLIKYQIRALGLLESIKVRQQGYSSRLKFCDFLARYKCLAFDYDETVEDTKDNCKLLLLRLKMDGWTLGKSKVFLKYYNEEYLARLYEERINHVIKVQSMVRAFLARNRNSKPATGLCEPSTSTLVNATQENIESSKEQKTPKKFKQLIRSLSSFSENSYPNSDDESKKVNSDAVEKLGNNNFLSSSTSKDKLSSISPVKSILKTFENQNQAKHRVGAAVPLTGRCFPVSPKNNNRSSRATVAEKANNVTPEIINPMVEFTNVSSKILSKNIMSTNSSQRDTDTDPVCGPYNFQAMLRKTNRNLADDKLEQRSPVHMPQLEKNTPKPNSAIKIPCKREIQEQPNTDLAVSKVQTVKLVGNLVLEGLEEDL